MKKLQVLSFLSVMLAVAACAQVQPPVVGLSESPAFERPQFRPTQVYGQTWDLQFQFATAKAGDVIVIRNGTYKDIVLTSKGKGSAEAPIIIMAQTPGQVFFEGTSTIILGGEYTILEGVVFRNGGVADDRGAIITEGDHCRVTNCAIIDYNKTTLEQAKWISIAQSQYSEIDHCTFSGKTVSGALLVIWRDSDKPNYHIVHHNLFRDFAYGGGANGWETIRLGTSHQSQSDSYSILSHNVFVRCDGEGELISVKAGKNRIVANSVLDSRGAISLRHGKDNYVGYNFIRGTWREDTAGIRVMDSGHVVECNYIEGVKTSSMYTGGITLMGAQDPPLLNGYWKVANVVVRHNTLVDSAQPFVIGGGESRRGVVVSPETTRFERNMALNGVTQLMNGAFVLVIQNRKLVNGSWDGNVFSGGETGLPGVTAQPMGSPASRRLATGQVMAAGVGEPVLWELPAAGAPRLAPLTEADAGASF